ncbi:MAG: peptidylprolyl isomerase, partial [Anaerolineales bacterium]
LAPVLAQLHTEYPDDVRIVYRHFPLFETHDKARLAAEAAEAAGAQDKFWEMHDLLFENQAAWANLPVADFRALLDTYATQLELDVEQFSKDLDGGKFAQEVQNAYDTAASIPLPGTPFLLFNGTPYQGPIDHWALAALVKLEQLRLRQFSAAPPDIIDPFRKYFATLRTARGDIVIELFAEKTPLTVNNFVFLAQQGWFEGVTFHRVLPGYVAQTGDPSGTGYGGPGYFIPDEIVPEHAFDAAGWVGMANAGPNTNGSQFFITLGPLPDLNGKYTLFGKVVSGLDVARQLTPRDPTADPEAPPGDAITSVTIEEK